MNPQLIRDLIALLGPDAVLSNPEDLMLYEYDGSVELGSPKVVVFPATTRDVSEIVRLANRYEVPLLGRGAGTGLSGGAIARDGGIVVAFASMNRILVIHAAKRPAPSGEMFPKIPVGRTRWPTASQPITSQAWNWCCRTVRLCAPAEKIWKHPATI